MAKKVSEFRDEMADREAIRDVLYRYCRSNDRCDEEMLRSCYWPDAEDDHMDAVRGIDDLVEYVMTALSAMRYNQHHTGNVLISIDGNRAEVESYVHAYHCPVMPDGSRHDVFGAGRYLDIFEKRDDEWRILKRVVVTDWFHDFGPPPAWENSPFGPHVRRGDLKPQDKSYKVFKRLYSFPGVQVRRTVEHDGGKRIRRSRDIPSPFPSRGNHGTQGRQFSSLRGRLRTGRPIRRRRDRYFDRRRKRSTPR